MSVFSRIESELAMHFFIAHIIIRVRVCLWCSMLAHHFYAHKLPTARHDKDKKDFFLVSHISYFLSSRGLDFNIIPPTNNKKKNKKKTAAALLLG